MKVLYIYYGKREKVEEEETIENKIFTTNPGL